MEELFPERSRGCDSGQNNGTADGLGIVAMMLALVIGAVFTSRCVTMLRHCLISDDSKTSVYSALDEDACMELGMEIGAAVGADFQKVFHADEYIYFVDYGTGEGTRLLIVNHEDGNFTFRTSHGFFPPDVRIMLDPMPE